MGCVILRGNFHIGIYCPYYSYLGPYPRTDSISAQCDYSIKVSVGTKMPTTS